MSHRDLDRLFARFRRGRDGEALAEVFRHAAPALLRRARRMLGDTQAAEDVVQDLFLSLLQNGTGYDPARPCLPFLIGALQRHAIRWRQRATRLELLPAPASPASDDPARHAAAREQGRLVERALAELPPASREVLTAYLRQQLTPTEIARRTGQRPGTVRVQIHRALLQLRRLLPGVPLLALAAALGGRGRPPAARRAPRWHLPVAAAAAAALTVVVLASGVPRRGGGQPPAAAAAVAAVAAVPLERVLDAPRAEAGAPPAASRAGRLLVRVVDGAGAPLPGVGVRAWPAGTDADFARLAGATDAAGQVAVPALEPGEWVVAVDRGVRCTASAGADGPCEPVVAVTGGSTVRGMVTGARGRPFAGAGIWVCHEPRHPWDGQIVAHADGEGRFELRHMPPMSVVGAVAPGHVPSRVQAVGPADRELALVLGGEGGTITGTVTGPEGPIAGAVVRIGRHPRAGYALPEGDRFAALHPGVCVRTDAAGRFGAGDLPPGRLEVLARAPRAAGAMEAVVLGAGESRRVDVRLGRGAALEGIVRDPSGAPLPDVLVVAHGPSQRHWAAARTAGDGRFRLGGLDPRRVAVEFEHERFELRELAVRDPALPLRVTLQPLPLLRGVLCRADGVPVDPAGFELGVHGPHDLRLSAPVPVPLDGDARFALPFPARGEARFFARRSGAVVWQRCTAGDGRVLLPAALDEQGVLRVTRSGFSPAECEDFQVFAQRGGDVYRLRPDAGSAPGELRIALPAGPWHLHVFGARGICPAMDLGVVDVGSGGLDLHIAAPPRGWLDYELACADGRPVEQLHAFLVDDRGRQVPVREPTGRIAVAAGDWRLWASSTAFAVVRGQPVSIEAGATTRLRLDLPRADLRQIAFWLPAGAMAATSRAHLRREGEPLLGAGSGLEDCGFDCAVDGYCSIAMALAGGRYELELETGVGRFGARFCVAGEGSDGEPLLLELGPLGDAAAGR